MTLPTIHLIAAARPNFMKIAPLAREMAGQDWCRALLVHTGQHYDAMMSDAFFRDLGLRAPDHHLGVGSGSHAEQTGGVMIAYERICQEARPDWIVVVGDVNSTLACSLVGAKLLIPVAHLEAGLRSFDRRMPEEVNRVLTDRIADLLWTPSADADANLHAEGIDPARVERVGNIMIDSYEMVRAEIERAAEPARLGLTPGRYAVLTLHRPSNVDDRDQLALLVDRLIAIAAATPIVFPVHPRTRQRLQSFHLFDRIATAPGMTLIEPLGYIAFMSLVGSARFIVTDSGGVQEETTYLGIACLTLRDTTERPITVTEGTNQLVTAEGLSDAVDAILAGTARPGRRPDLWDGRTAKRVAASLKRRLAS